MRALPWETGYAVEDEERDDDPKFLIETVHDLHRRKKLTCPICGDVRPLHRADAEFCDAACEWLAPKTNVVPIRTCAAEGCSEPVPLTTRGRPRKFHSRLCKTRTTVRLTRERQDAQR